MSFEGGSAEEFEAYWNGNSSPRHLAGGWVEHCAHPQVNCEPYWYNSSTDELTWSKPEAEQVAAPEATDGLEELSGVGPVWEMSIPDLKVALAAGREEELGLGYEDLARRAVAEYENFLPRVLSWHDYQYLTFWFFGGLKQQGRRGSRGGSFFRGGGAGPELFAGRAFFLAAAEILMQRMHRMHPINLTYFVWTFSRAGVVIPEFMEAVGDYFCAGRNPMCDRCSLGTMVWNFSKQGVSHHRFFEDAAKELSRPNRVRSLAPRNFQNTMIAYGKNLHRNDQLLHAMFRGMRRQLDEHDPPGPKLARSVCFPYICKDGSTVNADSWRISGLTIVLVSLRKLRINGESVERCLSSMMNYMQRSFARSPKMMRERGDAGSFLLELARVAEEMPELNVLPLLQEAEAGIPWFAEDMSGNRRATLFNVLRQLGISANGSGSRR